MWCLHYYYLRRYQHCFHKFNFVPSLEHPTPTSIIIMNLSTKNIIVACGLFAGAIDLATATTAVSFFTSVGSGICIDGNAAYDFYSYDASSTMTATIHLCSLVLCHYPCRISSVHDRTNDIGRNLPVPFWWLSITNHNYQRQYLLWIRRLWRKRTSQWFLVCRRQGVLVSQCT